MEPGEGPSPDRLSANRRAFHEPVENDGAIGNVSSRTQLRYETCTARRDVLAGNLDVLAGKTVGEESPSPIQNNTRFDASQSNHRARCAEAGPRAETLGCEPHSAIRAWPPCLSRDWSFSGS